MPVDVRAFFQATNPSKTLVAGNPEDQNYYIDFSEVRGGKIIEELKDTITFFSPDDPTCVLFTGHIGCGKSTELLRLKAELEAEGFFVVYFESSEDLEMADVDIGDVLLAIAKRVSESLEAAQAVPQAQGFRALLESTKKVLLTEIEVKAAANVLGGKVAVDTGKQEMSLSAGIAELTVVAKNNQGLRDRLNQYLGPQKNRLLDTINQELLQPAIAQLKQQGKKGLVVIVDNLDRIEGRPKYGKQQQEYLFVDQSECLTRLQCHTVYTMPLALKFSNEYGLLTQRYDEPKVLPMVPVQFADGRDCEAGLSLLRQMVLARALPQLTPEERLNAVAEVFEVPESLDRLCRISGGHVRDLLRLLNDWIKKGRQLPLKAEILEDVIRSRRNELTLCICAEEWELLKQVKERKKVSGDQGYQTLIRSRMVFEYRDRGESWFDINPLLADAQELQ